MFLVLYKYRIRRSFIPPKPYWSEADFVFENGQPTHRLLAGDPTDRLISAIADAPMTQTGGLQQTVAILVRNNLTVWAADAQRCLVSAASGIALARDKPLSSEGHDALEGALWRIAAAKKSLLAVCCVALDVRVVHPGWTKGQARTLRNSVEFDIKARHLGEKLVALADKHPVAAELNNLLLAVAEHPAIELRDEITHSLAPIKGAEGLVYFEILDVGTEPVRGKPVNFVWPHGMAAKTDISSEALWNDAVNIAASAHALLWQAVDLTARLLQEAGVAERPQTLYRNPQTGEIMVQPE